MLALYNSLLLSALISFGVTALSSSVIYTPLPPVPPPQLSTIHHPPSTTSDEYIQTLPTNTGELEITSSEG